MKATLTTIALATAMIAAIAASAGADEKLPAKWVAVEGLVNDEPSFMIHVDVDHENRIYRKGDTMTVGVKAEKECYVYLFYYSGDDAVLLFPNQHQQNNLIPAQTAVAIPGDNAPFLFRTTGPPFGQEVLHVIASEEPIDAVGKLEEGVPFKSLSNTRNLKPMVVEVKKKKLKDWAEARIDITTIDRDGKPPASGKRVGVCVGISEYQHDRVQDLAVSHLDAQRMAEAMKQECGLDEVLLLTNQEATRAAIEQAIFHDLVAGTRPGDSVFIFFSGHGGRTSDQNGDEEDGFDEYLVPHDGILGKPETMILDDTFARWMQELSGREVTIIMDNCYSGGASKALDGGMVAPKGALNAVPKAAHYDGMEMELKRSKDLGQKNTVILAACQANQLAWEMPASQKGSVLTHYLIESLKDDAADVDRDGNLTIQESYGYVKQKVEKYVKDKFQTDQNPIIVDNSSEGIILKRKS